ncbi:MAG: tRNA lysidine(34) synthetase TilS, partial [Lachnospiraceae bacterium]|nr:tRNA lysidine(34) synthetase TilS [Lachnospiraceae bacterium]
VRTRQEGDFFVLDEGGGTQRLKRYFVNEKIPGARRDEILLVAEGKHILWIVGLRISAYYKVTPQTKNVLEIRYNGGRDEDE